MPKFNVNNIENAPYFDFIEKTKLRDLNPTEEEMRDYQDIKDLEYDLDEIKLSNMYSDTDKKIIAELIDEINNTQVLSADEETILLKQLDGNDAMATVDKLFKAYLKLVLFIVHKDICSGIYKDIVPLDVIQYGIFGLLMAIEKYDSKSGYDFATCAAWWISKAIKLASIIFRI